MKNFFKLAWLIPALFCCLMSSCADKDEHPVVPDEASKGYCLAFYCSGGDPAHDISFMNSIRSALSSTGRDSLVTLTALFKYSGGAEGEAHNGVRRFSGAAGALTLDSAYNVPENFNITDPANLSDFLRWTAAKFPDREYIFVYAGHGMIFIPYADLPEEPETRATLYDDGKVMTTAGMALAIREVGIPLAAMIANSCQQGSIEMMAEWEGLADYFIGSPFSIPDVGYDYASLVNDLRYGYDMEQTLVRTAKRTLGLWQEYHDGGFAGSSIDVVRLNDLSGLWPALNASFSYMRDSAGEISYCTDPPAIEGEKYGSGYMRALEAALERKDSIFEVWRPGETVDLGDFLRNAFLYTGNILLASYVNRADEEIDRVVAYHGQTDGRNDFIFNVYFEPQLADPAYRRRYEECRFDRLTGWSRLCAALLPYAPTPSSSNP